MPSQEKAVIKAMRRHQRDGRRFRDLLVHCACGWKSPALKARKGSNDFALAREDQAKSFERHVAREVLAATGVAEAPLAGKLFDLIVNLKGAKGEETVTIALSGTDSVSVACMALHQVGKPEYIQAIMTGIDDPEGWVDA